MLKQSQLLHFSNNYVKHITNIQLNGETEVTFSKKVKSLCKLISKPYCNKNAEVDYLERNSLKERSYLRKRGVAVKSLDANFLGLNGLLLLHFDKGKTKSFIN